MIDLSGSITALVTPFTKNDIDEDKYQALIERQIKAGTRGIVPAGTTGESATITHDEHQRLIKSAVKASAGLNRGSHRNS